MTSSDGGAACQSGSAASSSVVGATPGSVPSSSSSGSSNSSNNNSTPPPASNNSQNVVSQSRLRPHAPPWSPRRRRWTSQAANAGQMKVPEGKPVLTTEAMDSEFQRMLRKFVHMDVGARRTAKRKFAKASADYEEKRLADAEEMEQSWRQSVKSRLRRGIRLFAFSLLQVALGEVAAAEEARKLHDDTQGSGSGSDDGDVIDDTELTQLVDRAKDVLGKKNHAPLDRVSTAWKHGVLVLVPDECEEEDEEAAEAEPASAVLADALGAGSADEREQRRSARRFENQLRHSVETWRLTDRYRCVWLRFTGEQAHLVPVAVKVGFDFEHARPGYVIMKCTVEAAAAALTEVPARCCAAEEEEHKEEQVPAAEAAPAQADDAPAHHGPQPQPQPLQPHQQEMQPRPQHQAQQSQPEAQQQACQQQQHGQPANDTVQVVLLKKSDKASPKVLLRRRRDARDAKPDTEHPQQNQKWALPSQALAGLAPKVCAETLLKESLGSAVPAQPVGDGRLFCAVVNESTPADALTETVEADFELAWRSAYRLRLLLDAAQLAACEKLVVLTIPPAAASSSPTSASSSEASAAAEAAEAAAAAQVQAASTARKKTGGAHTKSKAR